jgi:excisionase family DNA binding protein
MRLTHSFDTPIIDRMSDQNVLPTDGSSRSLVWIPDPDEHPTISVPHAARIAGVARRTGYAAAQRGEWPAIRVGRAVRIRTRQFLELYGPKATS